MANKAVLDVELNDEEFTQFQERFHKLQEEAKKANEVWSKGAGKQAAPQGFKAFFDGLQNVTKEQKIANQNFRVTAGAWNSSVKYLKQFHHFVSQSTFQLLRWTGLTSLFGSILSAGGLYGINRMAQTAMTMRQQAGGYGVTPGELAAVQTAFDRLGDMSGVLQGFSNALHDIQKRRPLVSLLGTDYNKRTAGKDASQVFVETLPDIKRKLDSLDERTFQLMTSNKGLGLDELGITPEMARRIRNMKPEEIQEMINIYKGGKNKFGVDDEVLKKCADFSTKAQRAGAKIETVFIHLFAPFTKGMERAVSIFTFVLKVAFKIGEKAFALLKKFWDKFNDLFRGKGTDFASNVKQFVAAARNIEEVILRFFGLNKTSPSSGQEAGAAVARATRKGAAGSEAEAGAKAGADVFGDLVKRSPRGIGNTGGGASSPTTPHGAAPKYATPWSPSSTGPAGTGGDTGRQSSPATGDTPGGPGVPSNFNQISHTFNAAAKHPEWGIIPGRVNPVKVTGPDGQVWMVEPRTQKAFQGFINEMHAKHPDYKLTSAGGYVPRNKRGGSTPSMHAYGTAIDINAGANPFHSRSNTFPSDTEIIAARHGLSWGKHFGDPMHFEYTGIHPKFNPVSIRHGTRHHMDNPKERGSSHTTDVQDNTGGAATVTHETKRGAIQ